MAASCKVCYIKAGTDRAAAVTLVPPGLQPWKMTTLTFLAREEREALMAPSLPQSLLTSTTTPEPGDPLSLELQGSAVSLQPLWGWGRGASATGTCSSLRGSCDPGLPTLTVAVGPTLLYTMCS